MSTKLIGIAALAAVAVFAAAFLIRTPDAPPAGDTQEQVSAAVAATSTDATSTPAASATTSAKVEDKPVSSAPKPSPAPAPTPAPAPAPKPNGYTMAQVAMHATGSSCWSAINGKVYDLTSWINKHPGGKTAILRLCGTDGSAAFNDQHGGQRRPESELAGFYLAPLI